MCSLSFWVRHLPKQLLRWPEAIFKNFKVLKNFFILFSEADAVEGHVDAIDIDSDYLMDYGDNYDVLPPFVEEGIERVKRSAKSKSKKKARGKKGNKNCKQCKGNHTCCNGKKCLVPKGSPLHVKDIVKNGNGCCQPHKDCHDTINRLKKRM